MRNKVENNSPTFEQLSLEMGLFIDYELFLS